MESTTVIGNVVVGKKQVDMGKVAHVRGVHEGNWGHKTGLTPGIRREDVIEMAGASRSTGISPKSRLPIDPTSPHLSPP